MMQKKKIVQQKLIHVVQNFGAVLNELFFIVSYSWFVFGHNCHM